MDTRKPHTIQTILHHYEVSKAFIQVGHDKLFMLLIKSEMSAVIIRNHYKTEVITP